MSVESPKNEVIVCFSGTRAKGTGLYPKHKEKIRKAVKWCHQVFDERLKIIHGGAKGVDSEVHALCLEYNIEVEVYYPEYGKYPKHKKRRAPLDRNITMIQKCNFVVAFPSNQKSSGTWFTINKANLLGKSVIISTLEF